MKQAIAAVFILLAWVGPAKAWSEDGHRIVCAMAWKKMPSETRALVDDLLKNDPASGFPEACLWADAIRSDPAYDWAKPHHYVNMPAAAASIDLARDCSPERSCVIRAITTHIGTLRHPNASAADKAKALKFLSATSLETSTRRCTPAALRIAAAPPLRSISSARRRACTRSGMAGAGGLAARKHP